MTRFLLEVQMDAWDSANTEQELGRILRYWGGNLKYYQLVPGDEAEITDSEYKPVGRWRIVAETDGQ
ncbi:MAG TPA: hypothetical protein VFC19_36505 [Candidatus Limnocylindrales bacterium]|nr:hypothetical protein [Candidatus Limnocylindrales bacterium]